MILAHSMMRKAGLVAFSMFTLAVIASNALAGVPGDPGSVPEIDPSSILSAMTLLSGGLLVLNDRRQRAK